MLKIEASRDEVKKVVVVLFKKQSEENAVMKKRTCEITGLKYDPKEKTQTQVMLAMVADPYTDYLTGLINRNECIGKIKNIFKENLKIQLKKDKASTDEEIKWVDSVIDNSSITLKMMIFTDSYEEDVRYFQRAFDLAREKGVAPQNIFSSEKLKAELIRSLYAREEYRKKMSEALIQLSVNTLIDSSSEDFQLDSESQQKISATQKIAYQIIEETLEKIWGPQLQ